MSNPTPSFTPSTDESNPTFFARYKVAGFHQNTVRLVPTIAGYSEERGFALSTEPIYLTLGRKRLAEYQAVGVGGYVMVSFELLGSASGPTSSVNTSSQTQEQTQEQTQAPAGYHESTQTPDTSLPEGYRVDTLSDTTSQGTATESASQGTEQGTVSTTSTLGDNIDPPFAKKPPMKKKKSGKPGSPATPRTSTVPARQA